ncbi:MAG: hypothetical protein JXA20_17405 [Spirochaetes bacterium]|nr:hypothetical protein [Spirochaetota bacterium]
MTLFKRLFLGRFESADFIIRKKANALMYYCLIGSVLMVAITLMFMVLAPHILLQMGIVTVLIFTAFCTTLMILRRGRYYLAANFFTGLVAILLTAAFLVKIVRDVHTGYTTYLYFMIAVIVQAVLFCRPRFVIALASFFVAADVIFFILARPRLEGLHLQAATVGFIDSTFSILFILVTGIAIMRINAHAQERVERESAENRKNFQRVQGLMESIREASGNVARSSEVLTGAASAFSDNTQSQAASAEQIMATVEEVSAGVDNVDGGARDQYVRMNELLGNIKSLSNTIAEMGSSITKALTVTRTITSLAGQGDESLRSMSDSMQTITGSSNEMTGIVKIINDISDRINLLSLNAAIEAARAGDAGRGFAVVADEISKLADQTSSSIKEIDSHIRVNNGEIIRGTASVGDAVEVIRKIIEGVNTIDALIDEISGQMGNQQSINARVNEGAELAMKRSDEMRIATEEQKTAVTEISRSISGINEITQKNSEESERLFGHAREVKELAVSLQRKMAETE